MIYNLWPNNTTSFINQKPANEQNPLDGYKRTEQALNRMVGIVKGIIHAYPASATIEPKHIKQLNDALEKAFRSDGEDSSLRDLALLTTGCFLYPTPDSINDIYYFTTVRSNSL